jgi:hypothetical protein
MDVAALGLDCVAVSQRLLHEKVAATPMRGWGGDIADRHVRFVFSNEPVERNHLLGDRVRSSPGGRLNIWAQSSAGTLSDHLTPYPNPPGRTCRTVRHLPSWPVFQRYSRRP